MDAWNPSQYNRFRDERSRPFFDLLSTLDRRPGLRVVDLGCGTGELTRVLHERLGAKETLGLDNSPSMLEGSEKLEVPGLRFEVASIENFPRPEESYDLIFSNAALQWLPDHPKLFARLKRGLKPGGMLAVQMPANHDHPSHLLAAELARESPFREALEGYRRESPVLLPEDYALLLNALGFREPRVRLEVYLHTLGSREDVVEWVKGTLLTDYEKRLSPELYQDFLRRYRERLVSQLPDLRPFPYTFKRIFLWGRN